MAYVDDHTFVLMLTKDEATRVAAVLGQFDGSRDGTGTTSVFAAILTADSSIYDSEEYRRVGQVAREQMETR